MLILFGGDGLAVSWIWFTDEAHFHLDGILNIRYWRFWGTENCLCLKYSHYVLQKLTFGLQYPPKPLLARFFLWETITTQNWMVCLQLMVFFIARYALQILKDIPGICWYMQDEARPHRTLAIYSFLEEYFSNRITIPDLLQQAWTGQHTHSIFPFLRIPFVGNI